MQIITSQTAEFNTFRSHSSVVGEITLAETAHQCTSSYKDGQSQAISEKLCDLAGYKHSKFERVIRALIKLSNPNNQLANHQVAIARLAKCSVDKVQRVIKQLVEDGHILSKRMGTWLERLPNQITLLFLKSKLPDVNRKMRQDRINNKYNINTNYETSVSKPRKYKKKEPDKPPTGSRFVNKEALQGGDRDNEVRRVCNAWSLTAKQTEYALKRMREGGITCPARFLAVMAKGLSLGTWNDADLKSNLPPEMTKEEKIKLNTKINEKAEALALAHLSVRGIALVQAQSSGEWIQCKMHFVRQLDAEARKLRESVN